MQKRSGLTLRVVGFVVLVIVAEVIVFSSYTIVSPGHRDMVVMLGRVEEGVHAE